MRDHAVARARRAAHSYHVMHVAYVCDAIYDEIVHAERGYRVLKESVIRRLMDLTELPMDAFIDPKAYLLAHPTYLKSYAQVLPKRGRPRQDL